MFELAYFYIYLLRSLALLFIALTVYSSFYLSKKNFYNFLFLSLSFLFLGFSVFRPATSYILITGP